MLSFYNLISKYPKSIQTLLLSALFLTLSRAITLPFVAIYLSEYFLLSSSSIGVVLGSSLILSTFISIYGGYVVDSVDRYKLLLFTLVVFFCSFLLAPVVSNIFVFTIFLTLINTAYSIVTITSKAIFADFLDSTERLPAFSFQYTLINIGFAFGPLIGVYVSKINSLYPFFLSGFIALSFSLFFKKIGNIYEAKILSNIINKSFNFRETLQVLNEDKQLIFFTIGGVLSSISIGQFTAYLSQYLVATSSPKDLYSIIGCIVTTNAIVVILFQYSLGKLIKQERLLVWLSIGLALIIIGLFGFSISHSFYSWVFSTIIFTFGEIVIIPTEYFFIDKIAPNDKRGSYYGVQNLTNFGSALGPIICGYVITVLNPNSMFVLLIFTIMLSWMFYFKGTKL